MKAMKTRITPTLAALILAIAPLRAADPVFDAMQAELTRSMTLSLRQLDTPYFISYTIDDVQAWSASASLGGITAATPSRTRRPSVQVRVGDYQFDNTNSAGGRGRGASYNLSGFPLDDDPLVIRQYLWLETDSAYKGAVQSIAQKRAAQSSMNLGAQLPDFAPAEPFTLVEDHPPLAFNPAPWNDRIKRVSAVFSGFPNVRDSVVGYNVTGGLHRYINSEGTRIRQSQNDGWVQIRAAAQAPDGMSLRDFTSFYTQDIARFPSEEILAAAARSLGTQLTNLAAAPIGEPYSGPILFEGQAAPQLMAELLARNLHQTRPVTGGRGGRGGPPGRGGAGGRGGQTELEGRRGVRIMPDLFNVIDDPTLPYFGHTEVDDEGVPSKPISLVEKGVLKDFFRTRLPMQGFATSNGRAVVGDSPGPTNLIVTTTEKTPLATMRQNLIDLCRQRGLAYGIVIRKLDFPLTGGGAGQVANPLYIYRVYPDGREQMIRGVRLRSVNARSLKDILLAGDDAATLDYVEGGSADVTVVSPSILIDDLELEKATDTLPKLPIAPSPLARN